MATPDHDLLRQLFDRAERMIEDRWEVPVRIQDVPNPFTGDLDGEQIMVDFDLDVEDAVFILVHLFGHTVQWNVSEQARHVAFMKPGTWTEPQLRELAAYEQQACRFSIQLMHDAGFHELDQWISDFAACDTAYLIHFYKTGEKLPFRSFWKDNAELLTALPIPDFQPTRWIGRHEGTVV